MPFGGPFALASGSATQVEAAAQEAVAAAVQEQLHLVLLPSGPHNPMDNWEHMQQQFHQQLALVLNAHMAQVVQAAMAVAPEMQQHVLRATVLKIMLKVMQMVMDRECPPDAQTQADAVLVEIDGQGSRAPRGDAQGRSPATSSAKPQA